MLKLRVPVRYYIMSTKSGECVESRFSYVHKELKLDVSKTALIIVDPWNTHYIVSWLRRAAEITRTKIAPIIESARKCGVKIIYAPSPEVAHKYPQWTKFDDENEVGLAQSSSSDWPPPEFKMRTGRYAEYRAAENLSYFPDFKKWAEEVKFGIENTKMEISKVVHPRLEDFVVATGNQLHRLLKHYKILHLIYCGFATNFCIQFRDYGVRAFGPNGKGYNLILIRDATTAVEGHDTIDNLLATKIAVRDIEMFGFSTLTESFLKACKDCFNHPHSKDGPHE